MSVLPKKLKNKDGNIVTEPAQIAETFNKHFANIGKNMARGITPVHTIESKAESPFRIQNSLFFGTMYSTWNFLCYWWAPKQKRFQGSRHWNKVY